MGAINFVKGIFIGIALVIPGLSGSMFAVVVGLYDKLLNAVSEFRKNKRKYAIFLLPILFGVAVGILSSTKFVLWVCEKYAFQSYAFFIGLVVGSIPLVYKKMMAKKPHNTKLIITLISFIAIIAVSIIATNTDSDLSKEYIKMESMTGIKDAGIILFAGAFSCSLMAIPGVSGSVMLMLINQYGTVYNAVSKLADMMKYILLKDWESALSVLPTVIIILPFVIGAVLGVFLIAKLLTFLLNKYESEVYYGVMGLVCGAIVILFKDGIYLELIERLSIGLVKTLLVILISFIFIIVGAFFTRVLDR